MQIYIVRPGDSISEIASAFHISVDRIIYDNQLIPPYTLATGQALLIMDEPLLSCRPSIHTGGYAYTYISAWVLAQTLPCLTDLLIFSYGFTMEGDLIRPSRDDTWMINAALSRNVRPILTLTPLDESGNFNNKLITSIVRTPEYSQNLIRQVMNEVDKRNFAGVNVDFEYILAADKDAYTVFIQNLADALHRIEKTISVALAPKTSADQPGLLYQGMDFAALGQAADHVLLMTYEWGYKYGPNMAVAPLNKVRQVVEYAVTEIPPEKIHLGIPNYGYDWPLPFVPGQTTASTIGNVEAVQITIQNQATIYFDELSQSPYFNYTKDGIRHEVWFEDVRSLKAKFDLIKSYGLSGTGYWQIMQWWRAAWLLQAEEFPGTTL